MGGSSGFVRGIGHGTTSNSSNLRPMMSADVPRAIILTWEAFGIPPHSDHLRATWDARMQMMLRTDPDGAFVAVGDDGTIVGVSAALARGEVWVLSLLAVDTTVQSRGAGRALMEAALGYRSDIRNRLVMSTNDPRAMRLYWQAGFELHPTMLATGNVKRDRLPDGDPRISEVQVAEIPELAPVSVALRGGDHTAELEMMHGVGARIFRLAQSGFVVVSASQEVWMLAALDEDSAAALLWHGLDQAGLGGPVRVRYVSDTNQWAIDILMEAGLDLIADGAVGFVGAPGPLHPYIPSGPLS